jgi:hypothetical protein
VGTGTRSGGARKVLSSALAAALVGLAPACEGFIGDAGVDPNAGARQPGSADASDGSTSATISDLTCDPTAQPAEVPLRRLSHAQYVNTIQALLAATVPSIASTVLSEVQPQLQVLPPDIRTGLPGDTNGGYAELDQTVGDGHVGAGYDLAVAIGKSLTSDTSRINALFGTCATNGDPTDDVACITTFLQGFGARAQRHPMADDDVQFYLQAVSSSVLPDDLADLIGIILTSPRFFYHVENGGTLVSGQTYALDVYELAARLSYFFWQAPPDDTLLAEAKSGAILTDAGYASEVQRLYADARTDASLDAFFREYLWLDQLPRLDKEVGTPAFDAFAGADRPTPTLHLEMIDDAVSSARWVRKSQGAFADFFMNPGSFAKSTLLASIYGTSVWDGTSAPPDLPPARAGLITRAALLVSASGNTRPIMKGFFIRHGLLCDDMAPPPPGALNTPIETGELTTTRQKVEKVAEQPGTVCFGCHATMIDALGFATESFDALGRARTVQSFYDMSGHLVGSAPIDTHGTPHITPDDQRPAADAHDLAKMLVASGRVQECFARQYFRFTFGRIEDRTSHTDDCVLKDLADTTLAGSPLADVLSRIALRPEFRRKSFQ